MYYLGTVCSRLDLLLVPPPPSHLGNSSCIAVFNFAPRGFLPIKERQSIPDDMVLVADTLKFGNSSHLLRCWRIQ